MARFKPLASSRMSREVRSGANSLRSASRFSAGTRYLGLPPHWQTRCRTPSSGSSIVPGCPRQRIGEAGYTEPLMRELHIPHSQLARPWRKTNPARRLSMKEVRLAWRKRHLRPAARRIGQRRPSLPIDPTLHSFHGPGSGRHAWWDWPIEGLIGSRGVRRTCPVR